MLAMSDEAKYEIFFDHFGHVIAYREVQGQTKYALLSELYYTNEFNGKYIKNNTPIVEITMGRNCRGPCRERCRCSTPCGCCSR